jgi:hypothetical protein
MKAPDIASLIRATLARQFSDFEIRIMTGDEVATSSPLLARGKAIAYGTIFPRVVPANAGIHTPCRCVFAVG